MLDLVYRRVRLAIAVAAAVVTLGELRHAAAQDSTALHGRLQLLLPNAVVQPAQDAVVWIASGPSASYGPAYSGSSAATAGAMRAEMASQAKRFVPHVLTVRPGEPVAFPNVDRIFHNAFSVSPGNQFDLGLYRKGASKSMTFTTPGIVRIYCNIHQDMAGYVLVAPSARAIVAGADGSFRLSNLSPGRHTIKVWHPMSGEMEATLDLQAGADRQWDTQLDATRFRAALHKNKFGQDYPPVKKDADRY